MSKFLKGTAILLLAGFITRILGFINRIAIARFIGEEGVGLYMMAYPSLVLVITITQFGLPVAISKTIAEAEARGEYGKIKTILVVSLATTLTLSAIFTPALILLAPWLAETLFTDNRTYYPLIAIAPVVPVIAVSSVLRGYFQGRQNMKPAAYSQILEQFFRIVLIAVMTKAFLPYGIEYAAAGAMLSAVIGEVVSFIYLLTTFKLKKKFRLRKDFFKFVRTGRQPFRELMSVAVPTTGSRLIGSISWFFEPIVVSHSLGIAGVAAAVATKQYGALTGFAMPLLLLPSFITYSLATSLVPAISEANSKNDTRLIEHRLQQSLRLSFLTGGIAVVVLYVLAKPLMLLMYGSENGAHFIQIMAPFFLFYYYQGPLQAALQALNLARAAMFNSLIGSVVKTAVIFLLASQPAFGINGAALGIITGFVLVTMLHFATVLKRISFSFYFMEYAKAFLAIGLSGLFGSYLYTNMYSTAPLVNRVLLTVFCMGTVYLLLVLFLKLIRPGELKKIPIVGGFLARISFR
ncbi:stage V sporulation protein B [Neobacillus notoginsengisoli]|uniref:Stage V sporulation protein B n=1 Tax=Neobacillus notoginsengisoli TaxID=1578198 RepID=A0A417YTY1_9BACI|nr:stage V sporulation protein B [Neobacillus notoginsengisoli]RHW40609.1 stage V sporulation protein B [Neobacillus notoginsengisoli]